MAELAQSLGVVVTGEHAKPAFVAQIIGDIEAAEYDIVEINDEKPWGAYIRLDSRQADRFVAEFFPDVTPEDARLGMKDAELSPKILIVAPGHRLSWQYHDRRAERWNFLTPGAYFRSKMNEPGEIKHAGAGEIVQFEKSERHRLVGSAQEFTVIAEIWQHTNKDWLSDEDDITRLSDDYAR